MKTTLFYTKEATCNFLSLYYLFNIAYIILSEFLFLGQKKYGECPQGNHPAERK